LEDNLLPDMLRLRGAAAREFGLEPCLVSKGHLVDIAEDHTEQAALSL
jgi:hypothetical protein